MTVNYLFPAYFKKIGWMMLVPFVILGIYVLYEMNIFNQNWWDEIAITGNIIALLFISFSREKDEDEYVLKIRMESLIWAVIVNCAIIILATFIFYDVYFYFLCVNMFLTLILFMIKFNLALYKFRKSAKHEE